jgi:hypothetical protein
MVRQFNYLKEVTKMSRFLKSMIALLAIAAIAAPAFASDLSLSGQVRVEGYYIDYEPEAVSYFDQRFRVQSVYKVSDEVKAVLRMDFGEKQWGVNGQDSVRNSAVSSYGYQVDKAYLQLDKEMFSLSAGQQYFGLGNTIAVDHVGTGFMLTTKTPVTFTAMFTKIDENGGFTDADLGEGGNTDDTDFYALNVGHKGENYNANLFYAVMDNKSNDDTANVIGLAGSFNMDAFKINAELNIFGGDDGAGTDYSGTQAYVDLSTAISEAASVGGFLLYAAGDDSDEQITNITDWGSFMPETYGYLATMQYVYGETFEPIDNAGIMSAALYGNFKSSDDLGFQAMIQYLTEEDDAVADFSALNMNVSSKYVVAKNTNLLVQVNYIAPEDDLGDDSVFGLWTQLQVNF